MATFEAVHKVGAVFHAVDVFDRQTDLQELVALAHVDRHPFLFAADGQQRWLIVEHHMAPNHPTEHPH